MEKPIVIGYNEQYAKSVTREEFVKQHAHHKGVDHGAYWDSVNPKKEEKKDK